MGKPSVVTVQLARFDSLQQAGTLVSQPSDVLFCGIAADTRAAATTPDSQLAFRFMVLGVYENEDSANYFINQRKQFLPWLDECVEIWEAVLQPFHHKGQVNYLNQTQPTPLFMTLADTPGPNAPIVVITTAGWTVGEGFDMNRVKEFSEGVLGIRVSMTAVEGLHSQQSFFFPGVLTYDPITVTIWHNALSIGKFAYGPGIHRLQMEKQKTQNLADRTSFTRCKVLRSKGTWHGSNPVTQHS